MNMHLGSVNTAHRSEVKHVLVICIILQVKNHEIGDRIVKASQSVQLEPVCVAHRYHRLDTMSSRDPPKKVTGKQIELDIRKIQ